MLFLQWFDPETPYDRISWKGDLSVELYEIDA